MREYIFVVRRLFREELRYHIIAKSREEAQKRYERGEYLTADWSRPKTLDKYIAEVIEPSTSKSRKRRSEQHGQTT